MAITTKTGAVKIQGTDLWKTIFDDYNNTIDAYDKIISSGAMVAQLVDDVGYMLPSGTDAEEGDYILMNGYFGEATSAIAGGTDQIISGTNWTKCDEDMVNLLNSKVISMGETISNSESVISGYTTGSQLVLSRFGKIKILSFILKPTSNMAKPSVYTDIYTIPNAYRGTYVGYTVVPVFSGSEFKTVQFRVTGTKLQWYSESEWTTTEGYRGQIVYI